MRERHRSLMEPEADAAMERGVRVGVIALVILAVGFIAGAAWFAGAGAGIGSSPAREAVRPPALAVRG
jgi:hypothetical protein